MKCYEPSEQIFNLGDKVIGIDWGLNGDKAVQVTFVKTRDDTLRVAKIKELKKE